MRCKWQENQLEENLGDQMGIQTNKAKVTIDFIWSGNVGDVDIEYQIKYHHTDDFGPTVSVSTDGGSDYYGFPADMFSEIVDFLRGEKMLKSSTSQNISNQAETAPKVTKKTLPIPVVDGKKETETETEEPTSVEPFEVTVDQVQSFGDSPEDEESVEEPTPQIKKKAKEEIDAQQAALERTAAVRRANENKDKKKIRRDTTANEEPTE